TRVPRNDQRYREAALQAIKLAVDLNFLDFNLENFLSRFVNDGPRTERETGSFLALAQLYRRHDFVENARDALGKVLSVLPQHEGARKLLEQLEDETKASAMVYEKILKEELEFRGEPARKDSRTYFESA